MFDEVPDQDLEAALAVPAADRLLQKDITRQASIPFKISQGAQAFGLTTVVYKADASAGVFNRAIPMPLPTVRLSLVWYLGALTAAGAVYDSTNSGLITKSISAFDGSGVLLGASIPDGVCYYTTDTHNLIITVKSRNDAVSGNITAYFYYAIYYDDPGVQNLGL